MVSRVPPEDYDIVVRFGGGLNTRLAPNEIDDREATFLENVDLDVDNLELRPRPPFDLLGTATNNEPINGFAQLRNLDGQISTLVQAGNDVYKWDGGSTFTSVGTVNKGSRIRGRLEANWLLDNLVIVTDLAGVTPVLQWDGSSLTELNTGLGTEFYAKYCFVARGRAFYGNVQSGTPTPHLLVGSALEDHRTISVSDRPSDSLSAADPFFIPAPDIRPINGILDAFGQVVISTDGGRIFQLTGNDARDFDLNSLYALSGATGEEPLAFIGNDVVYGRNGRIETLRGTLNFGDVETDDLSRWIKPTVNGVTKWAVNYDPRTQRVYFWPINENRVFVFHKQVESLSPWSIYRTQHSSNFERTASMTMFDPNTGLPAVLWGDSSGNIYRFNGTSQGDPGSNSVKSVFRSRVYSAPLDSRLNNVEGQIRYSVEGYPVTLTIRLKFGGRTVYTQTITESIDAPTDAGHWSESGNHFNSDDYWGSEAFGRLTRKRIAPAGISEDFQIEIEADTDKQWEVNEIRLRFSASS